MLDTRKPRKLSRTQKPDAMSVEEWQIALRREFGRAQAFRVRNLNGHAVYSDFEVTNPQSKRSYRVTVRGERPGESRCTCPDFATNTLGTCKHIEFVLEHLRGRRGGKTTLKRGWQPEVSEVWLSHGAQRRVAFRPIADAPKKLRTLAARWFDADGTLRPTAFGTFETFLREAARLGHEVHCDDAALDFIARVRDDAWRRAVIDEKYAAPGALDGLIRATLYPYQREGVLFAARAGRTLLGDEMGLGKTIQAIALAELMAREFGVERVLAHKWRRYHFLSESDQRRLTIALLRMRMSCDDAFLVDHVTRAGTKIDELMTLLGELLEEPETRVVVFSQWTRMHDLICERLDERDWGYAYLHGGVPSRERKNLIARFREPDTRIFLSTDAGGTGLNLQHASVVINLDLPWNPAVLEQRIGRVHRLGQQRNVRAVNFVAEGTIEHGMLRLLDFKKDLFAGVLDGGESDISMDKPRLQKFMEVVDAIETQTPAPAPMEETAPVEEAAPVEETVPTTQEAVPLPLQSLLEAGAALLQGLATAVATPSTPSRLSVERDEATGQASLRIPLPDADTLQRLAAAAGPLLELLKGR